MKGRHRFLMNELMLNLEKPINTDEYQRIELFRYRFRVLWQNWESLKKMGIKLGGSFTNHSLQRFTGNSCNIESFRLKGYYVDFRFFFAEKEHTYYYKIIKIIGKYCHDKRLQKCLKTANQNWENAGILRGWHGYKADDLLNYWFNGEIFHIKPEKRDKVKKILERMDSGLAHHLLTIAIYDRMLVLRNINWMLQPLSMTSQVIRLSESYV